MGMEHGRPSEFGEKEMRINLGLDGNGISIESGMEPGGPSGYWIML